MSEPLKSKWDMEVDIMTQALRRAAKKARKFALATNTPFYVMRNGKIVNLTAIEKRKKAKAAQAKKS